MIDEHAVLDDGSEQGVGGLYLTDIEIIRRLGYGEKCGYRILQSLDRGVPGLRTYPQKDKLFAGRRFWPDVFKWHMEYHRVLMPGVASPENRSWEENFDAPTPRKARNHERAGPQLAPT